MGLMQELSAQPAPLSYWLNWMVLVNLVLPLVFVWWYVEARVIIATFLANAVFMTFLYEQMGFGGHLGLAHVVFWTPLVIWLAMRLGATHERTTLFATYLAVVLATNSFSLGIDYVDVSKAVQVLG